MPGNVEQFSDSQATPAVRGFLHRPATPPRDGLVLTHGAGSDCNAPLLRALAETLADAGWSVLRCDLPFRQSRPHGPPRGSGAEDREGLRRAVEVSRKLVPGRVLLGGQSYGGRQASMLSSEEPALADGLLLLSYPLHPPGKPHQPRTKHLPKIQVPALFVSGSADPFGSPTELQAALRLIPAQVSFLLIEGAGHDLGFGRRVRAGSQDVPQRIARAFLEHFPAG
jgi:predicted alpha/beta-hydrolase family hydrolase